ncbi:hypothetical protein [Azospirillum oryzae]|uniref:hypothetical protein n=1 Tax=Azospirillum oryzae TaxID=286727 RepID=UPI001178640C|nr:hypothetical protein [Azospirillum oryzae]
MTILVGATVLIAEPSATVASGLRAIIELWGGACHTVHSPAELRVALHKSLPDMLLVNVDLAGGYENLCVLARRYPIKMIGIAARFLSPGSGNSSDITWLEMPFTVHDLQRAVVRPRCLIPLDTGSFQWDLVLSVDKMDRPYNSSAKPSDLFQRREN